MPGSGEWRGRTLPVFSDRDEVSGVVLLDPHYFTSSGCLTITVRFFCTAFLLCLTCNLQLDGKFVISHTTPHDGRRRGTQQHTFLTSSQIFYTVEANSTQSRMTLRETLANTVRQKPWRPRANSVASNNGFPPNLFPFKFDIPQGQRGQEMPPSFSISSLTGNPDDGAQYPEDAEVSYTITAVWEAASGSDRALCVLLHFLQMTVQWLTPKFSVEAPIILHPETEFDIVDGSSKPQAWLELPLRTDRPRVPFQCAVSFCSLSGSCIVLTPRKITLPDPASFSKHGKIPFFVVFTTQPRSRALCREIAADATIAVSLLRKVTVNIERPCTIVSRPYSAPVTNHKGPPSAWNMGSNIDEVDSRPTTTGILKRMVKSAPPRLAKSPSLNDLRLASSINKGLPPLPSSSPTGAVAYAETTTLQTRMTIGFPKRPRSACARDEHPSLEAHAALPDGLYKGKIHLNPQLLPSIDWAGLNVKVSYYCQFHGNNRVQVICVLILDLNPTVLH